MVGVLRIAVITLQLSNVVLLSALLVTPARKHPISPQRFAHLLVHSSLGRWCVADAMILSYLTVVKAAFAVSFTSPCLYYALKFNRKRDPVDAPDSNPHFYTLTLAVLCIGPFGPLLHLLVHAFLTTAYSLGIAYNSDPYFPPRA
ncbi:hypothetical protein AcV7_000660 [Taiwanofungus camphoratus]|nr:hypothetical protein AcV7_000660 [Antrodia cinnamomea]